MLTLSREICLWCVRCLISCSHSTATLAPFVRRLFRMRHIRAWIHRAIIAVAMCRFLVFASAVFFLHNTCSLIAARSSRSCSTMDQHCIEVHW